jgi:TPR repeat protein
MVFGASLVLSMPLHAQRPDTENIDPKALEKLAERGNPDAQFEVGIRYLSGEGFEKNQEKAVKWLQKAAEQSNLSAMNALGTMSDEGIGLPKDAKKAFDFYQRAARGGFPLAQQNLAECYEEGKGVEKNLKEAAKWLERAAHQDFAPAQAAYAWKLEHGSNMPKDSRGAAEWYLRAAQQGLIAGMTRLAYLYYTGTGVPVDYQRAEAWYRRAARSEDPWASNDLAWFLAVCPDDTFHDGDAAVEYARLSVEKLEGKDYQVIDTLAAALARSGKFGEAVQLQKKTIVMFREAPPAPESKNEDRSKLEKELTERLIDYKKQTPFTEEEPKAEPGTRELDHDNILEEDGTPYHRRKPKENKDDDGGKPVVMTPSDVSVQLQNAFAVEHMQTGRL